ncbi:tetratricopeptide repeat protein [Pseudacidobacterium ailaaui]|uniref:tetratricopeptide repeat protein n=1 Tax=Pseudacidobacterium ailaaui TaxID=1382359 RepID=UPI0004788231|nr:tetratricopeptide repeat protein [Pseudacidobacterium ailaaui]MBX6360644.1 tetratricopeptide repeat protein [Pseudacidobacterium ailaaui]MCL6464282.1 tetratricopeptide repeat protein [Pseudacidobacterium ailaaui]
MSFAFLICFMTASGTLAAQDAQVVQYLRSGSEAMRQGNAKEAEKDFRMAIAAAPQFAPAQLDLGLALLREGNPEEAIAALNKAIALDPTSQGAHLFLGIAEYQRGHLDAARTALKQEVAQYPHSVEALTWLGIIELAAGHADAATAPLDEAAKLSPDDVNVLDYRGRAHSLVAAESYAHMRELDPDSWHVHRALGQTYADMGNPQAAIKEYQAALAKQPNNADLYEALGAEYQKLSQFQQAEQAYENELKLSPDNPVALYNLGRIEVENGDPSKGVALLRKAVPMLQQPSPGEYYLGLGLEKLGKDEESIEWLEKSLAGNPSSFIRQGAYFLLARLYQRQHRPEDASRALAALKQLKAQQQLQNAPAR